jgi:hypothetical protein
VGIPRLLQHAVGIHSLLCHLLGCWRSLRRIEGASSQEEPVTISVVILATSINISYIFEHLAETSHMEIESYKMVMINQLKDL